MDRVSVFEAKARLSEIVSRAQRGVQTVITKHGKPVARVIPEKPSKWDRSAILDEAETLRKTLKVSRKVKLAELLAEDRL